MTLRMEPIKDPGGLLIFVTGPTYRRIVRERLATMDLEYTEYRGWWKSQFFVTIPQGLDSGNLREWLRKRGL